MRVKLTQRSAEYLRFVRTLPCAVDGCPAPSEAHHTKKHWLGVSEGGMGLKGSDFCAIPLCHEHHAEIQHRNSVAAFEDRYALEIPRVIAATLIRFITRGQETE